ncbi:MAG: phosphatidylinositol kinase [Acidimicrobiia bacterium]
MTTAPLELVDVLGRMAYASNTTLLAVDAEGCRWVYKPERGEEPLWDFSTGTLARREILAYEVSAAMGFDIVPRTVEATGVFGPGSAQQFIDEDVDFDPRPLYTPRLDDSLWPFAVFDIVANNADRKIGHVLSEVVTGRLWAIDNGLTFHPADKLRTVLWGFASRPIPAELMTGVEHLAAALETGLEDRTAELLSVREADALIRRVADLLARPVHPHPPDDRPAVPWPVW